MVRRVDEPAFAREASEGAGAAAGEEGRLPALEEPSQPAGVDRARAAEDVVALFQLVLGRDPDPDALAAFTEAVSTGTLSLVAMVRELMTSDEAAARRSEMSAASSPSIDQRRVQVDQMFHVVLSRAPDPEAREAYAAALMAGADPIGLVGELLDSEEFGRAAVRKPSVARTVAEDAIASLMQRPATGSEIAHYAEALRAGYALSAFLNELAVSAEKPPAAGEDRRLVEPRTPYEIGRLAQDLIIANLEARGQMLALPPLPLDAAAPLDGARMRSLLLTLGMLAARAQAP